MGSSERNLQRYLIISAELHDIFCRKIQAVGHVGFPDVFLARNGRIVLVELKSPTGKGRLSKKQEKEIERLQNAGINVYLIDSCAGVDDVIKNLADA
mgnify:FL=1|jgi:hypothetical protein|tara:strand:- start:696 stop:986 length:291 start_codon:yes stop_codon:yes gene_type:complete